MNKIKSKILAFLPNAFSSSYITVLDEIQNYISEGNELVIIGCEASIKHCEMNLKGSSLICYSCTHCMKNSLKLLKGNFEYYSYKSFLNNDRLYKLQKIQSLEEFKSLKYRDYDIGYAISSTYISETRNQEPIINKKFRRLIQPLFNDSVYLFEVGKIILKSINPNKILIFNGRLHSSRPFLALAHHFKIPIDILEVIGGYGNKRYEKIIFENHLPHSIAYNTSLINSTWKNGTKNKKEIAISFFRKRKEGAEAGDKAYTKNQIINHLPKKFDNTKVNIVVFISSEDELSSIGKEWEWKIFGGNQITAMKRILDLFRDYNNIHFYVRIHPNLKGIKYRYHTNFHTLDKLYTNVTIIPADSKISSYALLDNCSKVITFGSTMGCEATFWGKPSILIGKSFYMNLDITYNVRDERQLLQLIHDHDLKPKMQEGTLKYGYYLLGREGQKFKFFDPNTINNSPKMLNRNFYLYNLMQNKKITFPVLINLVLYSTSRLFNNLILRNLVPSKEN